MKKLSRLWEIEYEICETPKGYRKCNWQTAPE